MNMNVVANTVMINLRDFLQVAGFPELSAVRGLDYSPRDVGVVLDKLPSFVVSFNYPHDLQQFAMVDQGSLRRSFLYVEFYYQIDDLEGLTADRMIIELVQLAFNELDRRFSLWGSVDSSAPFTSRIEQVPITPVNTTGILCRWGWVSVEIVSTPG